MKYLLLTGNHRFLFKILKNDVIGAILCNIFMHMITRLHISKHLDDSICPKIEFHEIAIITQRKSHFSGLNTLIKY